MKIILSSKTRILLGGPCHLLHPHFLRQCRRLMPKKWIYFHLAGSTLHSLSGMLRMGSTLLHPNRFSFPWAAQRIGGRYLLILASVHSVVSENSSFYLLANDKRCAPVCSHFRLPHPAIWLVFQRFPSFSSSSSFVGEPPRLMWENVISEFP